MINSEAISKRAIKKFLHGLENAKFYWDNILVHTRTWEEHIKARREFCRRLLAAGMTIRPTKCLFGVSWSSLGGRCNWHGLHEDNVTKIRDSPRPTTKKQIRSFIGFGWILQRFYPQLRCISSSAVRPHA